MGYYVLGLPFIVISKEEKSPDTPEHGNFIIYFKSYYSGLRLFERDIENPREFGEKIKKDLEETGCKVHYIKIDGSNAEVHYSGSLILASTVAALVAAIGIALFFVIVGVGLYKVTTGFTGTSGKNSLMLLIIGAVVIMFMLRR